MFRVKTLSLSIIALCAFSTIAQAGGLRSSTSDNSFFLFDLFGSAPQSIYRKPQVRGFKKRVGGYSYKYQDSWTFRPSSRNDHGLFSDQELFGGRIVSTDPDNF